MFPDFCDAIVNQDFEKLFELTEELEEKYISYFTSKEYLFNVFESMDELDNHLISIEGNN